MPRSFDRFQPQVTHDPLAGLEFNITRNLGNISDIIGDSIKNLIELAKQEILDSILGAGGTLLQLTEWATAIFQNFDAVEAAQDAVKGLLDALMAVFGGNGADLGDVQEWKTGLDGLLDGLQSQIEGIPGVGDFFELVTGVADSDPNDAASWIRTNIFGIRDTANSADTKATNAQTAAGNASTAASNAAALANAASAATTNVVQSMFNTWFGSGSNGSTQDVITTVQAIKDATMNGYTVETKTASGTWTKPAGLSELVVICVGAGEDGGAATNTTGGSAGLSGGFIVQAIPVESVGATVSFTVGTSNGARTSFGSFVQSNPSEGGQATQFGYAVTASIPGDGGKGGDGYKTTGTAVPAQPGGDGGGTPLAAGGAGGAIGPNDGAPGGAADAGALTKCGGGGGGGGGGGVATLMGFGNGGNGANGGFPGGGAGGAGSKGNPNTFGRNGTPGKGAPGVLWIFWKA